MTNENEIIKLTTEKFLPYLQDKFSKKFEVNLEGLRSRFLSIYSLLKMILEQVIELDITLQKDSKYPTYKPLLDNMVMLLTMMIEEYNDFFDLEFVEHFFLSAEERLKIFIAHSHQLFHIKHPDPNINYKISQCVKVIENAINLIPNYLINLQKRAELSVPLLKYIKDCKVMFRTPLKKLKDEIKLLAGNKSYEDFERVMEDIKNRSKNSMKFPTDLINKMIDLGKQNSEYQIELNRMLKPYYAMASLIKAKGKKFLNQNMKSTDQTKLLNYVSLLLRNDFVSSVLPTSPMDEMINFFKLLESQTNLVSEYKKTLIKGIEEYEVTNLVEFVVVVDKYKEVISEVNNFQDFIKKNSDNLKMNKESANQISKDIKKVVDKHQEFQNGIYHYKAILDLFQKIRDLAAKFCFNEFGEKVELICEYNL